jgi:hypothetical protein
MTKEMDSKKGEGFTRRDFLRIAGAGSFAFLYACSNVSGIIPPTPQGVTETAPTLSPENILAGSGEFTNGDPSLPETLKGILSKDVNIDIPIEAAVPFSIKVGEAEFDFVSLSPLENKELGISWDEKVFMKVGNTLADLDKKVVTVDGNDLVVWSYIDQDGTPEPTLWHSLLTKDEWLNMTPEQKRDIYAGFAPPTQSESEIPGFLRNSDKVFAISFAGLPNGAYKVLAALAAPVTPEPTATPEIKQYKICTVENYEECPVPVEDLYNGDYLRWLKTLSKPFDPSVKNIPFMPEWPYLDYPPSIIKQLHEKPSSNPLRKGPVSSLTTEEGYPGIILNWEGHSDLNPDENQWLTTAMIHDPRVPDAEWLRFLELWASSETPVIRDYSGVEFSKLIPLWQSAYQRYPDMRVRTLNFRKTGDPSYVSGPGIILPATVNIPH